MKRFLKTPFFLVAAALALSACASPGAVSRNAPFDQAPIMDFSTQDWGVVQLVIDVPRDLSVSEANGLKPRADIVWREDPAGDRHAQVEAIFQEALAPVLTPETGSIPVIVRIEVTKFHAVTERARYTIGGEHEIEFMLTVFDAESGMSISGPRPVDLTFRAHGGQAAIDAEAQGITQRVRITERLVNWAASEFPAPPATLLALN